MIEKSDSTPKYIKDDLALQLLERAIKRSSKEDEALLLLLLLAFLLGSIIF